MFVLLFDANEVNYNSVECARQVALWCPVIGCCRCAFKSRAARKTLSTRSTRPRLAEHDKYPWAKIHELHSVPCRVEPNGIWPMASSAT